MVRKKSASANLQKLLERPWCYYCERDFDDLKVLISHQRALHFKCEHCNRRLNTAGGLVVHVQQMHKELLTQVYNSIKGREDTSIEIFGLEGIPPEAVKEHEAQLREKYNIPDSVNANSKAAYLSFASRNHDSSSPPPTKVRITTVDREEIQARLKAYVEAKKAAKEENEDKEAEKE
ncbi:uncharacterized protein V2V93DRAFT_371805 [Kockiozyma suomiensis]|uniref:uncharacterized protein n=1 Tax=Kockiozyma suomiensis TaxID=1337062 RepID=UPI003344290C